MVSISRFSFGGTAAIVTSMALIVGLNAATATKATIISGLLVVALADNLTDSLSIHIYQESERLEERNAFITTLTNFTTRLVLSISFVLLVLLLPITSAIIVSVIWGFSLLIALTYMLARDRNVSVASEVFKHVAVALMVIIASQGIGAWIPAHIG
jgi:VIT1/CCC1 family predicted Fe2+/Mn2+ transporter